MNDIFKKRLEEIYKNNSDFKPITQYLNSPAEEKFKRIMHQIYEFEQTLDSGYEVAICLISFGSSILLSVEKIEFNNPDLLYFIGNINGEPARLIQHTTQLNFLLTSMKKVNNKEPARRIGFIYNN